MPLITIDDWRVRNERRRRRIEWAAEQAKREIYRREASDRLKRLLDGDYPPFGGNAA